MSFQAKEKFIQTGLTLYPQLGYRKLSVRILAAEAGLSPGLFHQLFESKDIFFQTLLQAHESAQVFQQEADAATPPDEALRQFMLAFAANLRADLPWFLRMMDDCAEQVDVVRDHVKSVLQGYFDRIEFLLRQSLPEGTEADYHLRRKFLILTTLAPILLGQRFSSMGILPLTEGQMKRSSDAAAQQQWMDWVFSAVLGKHEKG